MPTKAKGYILGAVVVAIYKLNAIRTAYPGRTHRSMVLSKFNVRRGEVSRGDAAHRPDEVAYYSLYMVMFV